MAHTFSRNYIHLVFSTKDRRKTIDKEMQPRLWAYLAGIAKARDMKAQAVGGTENHVHILFELSATMSLARAALLLKANSSKWMNEQRKGFAWQEGYGAFSVSPSNSDAVIRYIQNQPAHHRKIGFEQEFRAILRRHGLAYDPKYMFG